MRPLIGVTASLDEPKHAATLPLSYIEAIVAAGGKPVIIPVMDGDVADELLNSLEGVVFPGGADVDPRHYNERPSVHLGRIEPLLDFFEIDFARKVLARNKPVLGICRGGQLLTVAAGGSLIQDIKSQIGGAMKHVQDAPNWHGTHEIVFDEDSLFARIHGVRRLWVNSFHHQSVKNPGDGFTVTARAMDGVSEGAESRKGFKLCVQWHPERMWKRDSVYLAPFQALVRAAKGEAV